MKKIITTFPIYVLFLASCATSVTGVKTPEGLKQDLTLSNKLSEGITKEDVIGVMGAPIKTDFDKHVEEWFYCSTGWQIDEHLVLFFHDNKLVSKTNYVVSFRDTKGVYGSCEKFIKMGNYRIPDDVVEIRSR